MVANKLHSIFEQLVARRIHVIYYGGQRTDLLFPDSITVEGFAPCGLFYTPIELMTFFFPL